ncbi:hypothetical protein ThrDRAFT_01749 [Frankia casuarinae]|uniref:hypothetical protein n=1 Tax=Frankia TaxID=1854 RepID=UPI0003CF9EE8|nr:MULTISPECIES: hypothetical protein [Frankia]KEZ38338.1 hypothetical protein CEDDRAFT_00074 [Frankia sp. CeD]ETA01923.1 hypothetical protein CcI6DRAFT_02608 [Frankia sp. CcI6]EYT92630.1 hypothetical protein ThrDRAFT_01749 [Frankia casuarinae]KDA43365.1 hypothetical protein BMG523Draft_01682 [Frankia sp. BMG5.23]KFB05472.1 hypothetical protein ALLO2DRAFT_01712 [Frankia sp. Allo2]
MEAWTAVFDRHGPGRMDSRRRDRGLRVSWADAPAAAAGYLPRSGYLAGLGDLARPA